LSSSLENFQPKLRQGRVIPRGSHIIFETDQPYNQIALPIILADLVLLCSGDFSVREIIERIYIKQRAVPFKLILEAIHELQMNGFFENGSELVLNSDLQSWMEHRKYRWSLNRPLTSRLVADRVSPTAYYALTLMLMVTALFGLQYLPLSPVTWMANWINQRGLSDVLIRLYVCGSLMQSARYLFRIFQLLLLTGKAYNVSLRLGIWGVYLYVGDEANDLFQNRLYTALFYVSQIAMGWSFLYCVLPYLSPAWQEPMMIIAGLVTFWELNPFTHSDGLKLVQSWYLSKDSEVASWHFENSSLLRSLAAANRRRDAEFARLCQWWGALWLLFAICALQGAARAFGPTVLRDVLHLNFETELAAIVLAGWLIALFYMVQAFVETLAGSLITPWVRRFKSSFNPFHKTNAEDLSTRRIVGLIQDLPLFSQFVEEKLSQLIEQSAVIQFAPGTFIVQQGELSSSIFVLMGGEVEVLRATSNGTEWTISLGSVAIFGEAALLDHTPLAIQVVAQTPATVLRIPVEAIRRIAEEAQVLRHLENFRNAILVNQFFASSPVFRSLSNESIEFLCSRGTLEYFEGTQRVFNQGDAGDSIYMILRGAVGVQINGVQIKRLELGNFFGEIALIANIPRTATIVTLESSVLFKITADAFWEILVAHIDLGVFIESVSETRLREDLELAPSLKPTGND
jgi:CRP-like cAMP-binding protein